MDRHYILLTRETRVLIDASTIEIVREALPDEDGTLIRIGGEWIQVDESFDDILDIIVRAYKNV